MRLSLTGRHVDVTPTLRQLVVRRLGRVERLLNDSIVSAQVVLTLDKRERRTEVTVHARGDRLLSAIAAAGTWPQSVTDAVEKVLQQAHTVKNKWRTRKRHGGVVRQADGVRVSRPARDEDDAAAAPALPGPTIVRVPRSAIRAMPVAAAAARLKELREPFLVVRDPESDRIAILVARPDGRVGLIDAES
jgi:putative sigma-54 modulation protein